MRKSILAIIIILIISGCSSRTQPAAVEPQANQSIVPSPTETTQPTMTPHSNTAVPLTPVVPTQTDIPAPAFPLSINDFLPPMTPINAENTSQLIPVASVNTESITEVLLTENQEKILLNTSLGVQIIDRATFSAENYKPQSGLVFGREFSPDGRRMAQLLPGNPKIFDLSFVVTDLQSGNPICRYEPVSPSNKNTLAFHEDGGISYLASGSENHLWRWDEKTCQLTLSLQPRWPVLAISEDGGQAAEGNDSGLLIYSTSTGARTGQIEISNVRGAYFLPDGNSILVTSKAGNAIYDLVRGEKTHDFPGNMGDFFASYSMSRDGQWLLIAANQVNRALRLSDYTLVSLPGENIFLSENPLLQNGDGLKNGLLVTQDSIWDIAKQGKMTSLQKYSNWKSGKTVLLSADQTRAAVSPNSEPYNIEILDLTSGKPLFTIPNYHQPISLPDGSGFIATSQGQTAFFDYASDQPLKVLELHYVQGLALENGDFLVWDTQGNIHQLDPVNQTVLHSTRLPFLLSESAPQKMAPAWAQGREYPFDDFLASFMTPRWSRWAVSHDRQVGIRKLQDGVVQLFKMGQNSQVRQEVLSEDVISSSTPGDVLEMTFSPDDRFAAGVTEQKIVIWDAATGQQLRTIPLLVPPGAVYDFEFSPDGNKLLLSHEKSTRDYSAGIHTDARLVVFDAQAGRQLKFFELKQDFRKTGCNIGMPFAITADSTQFFTITENCRLGLFDMSSGELKREFHEPFKDANIDLAFSPDNRLLAIAYQTKLEVWDVSAGTLIKSYSNPALHIYPPHRDAELSYLYQVAFSPDGTFLGTRFSGEGGMGYNSIITLWGVPSVSP